MFSLSAADLLTLWEEGLEQSSVQRALLLLSACISKPPQELAQLTVGQRDTHLLDLRARIFGPQLIGIATCPGCGQQLELCVNVRELWSRASNESNTVLDLKQAGYETTFRVPTSLDLAQLRSDSEVGVNRSRLIELCVLSARHGDTEIPACQLPEEVVTAIAERMAEADPYAYIQLASTCPQCRHQWLASLDIACFLWREIEALAQRLLNEVHLLAAAYGWSEHDILSLSPARRQFYLSRIVQ